MIKNTVKISRLLLMLAMLVSSLILLRTPIGLYVPDGISDVLVYADKFYIAFALFVLLLFRKKLFFPRNQLLLGLAVIIGLLPLVNDNQKLYFGLLQSVLTLQGVLAFIVFSNIRVSVSQYRSILNYLVLFGVLVFILSVFEFLIPSVGSLLHGKISTEAVYRGSFASVQSIFGHPGVYSWFMGLCFSITFPKYYISREKVFLFLALLFLLGVFISLRRRTMIACLVVALVTITISSKKDARALIKTAVSWVSVVVLISVVLMFNAQVRYLIEDAKNQYLGAASPRVMLAETSVEIANDSFPLGSGFATFGSWMSRVNYSDLYYEYGLSKNWGFSKDHSIFITDTYWPMLLAEMGWIGLFIFLLYYYGLLVGIFRFTKLKLNSEYIVAFYIGLLVYVQALVESFSTPVFSKSPQAFLVMSILGLSFSLARNRDSKF